MKKKQIDDCAPVIQLTPEDQKAFVETLLDPPEPAPALVRAFQRHRQLIGNVDYPAVIRDSVSPSCSDER